MTPFRIVFLSLLLLPRQSLAQSLVETKYSIMATSDVVKAATHSFMAIRELGNRRERSAIPLLEKIAEEPDVPEPLLSAHHTLKDERTARQRMLQNLSHTEAKIALAKMGEGKYFQEFAADLQSTDGWKRVVAIVRLGDIGDKKAVSLLIPILAESDAPPANKLEYAKPYRELAEQSLERILPTVYSEFSNSNRLTMRGRLYTWKAWWKTHHAEYENLK